VYCKERIFFNSSKFNKIRVTSRPEECLLSSHEQVIASWLEALADRHLTDLTRTEVARALRALSSCYVERRSKLSGGHALATRGKRAAFALFYGPLHFIVARAILRAMPLTSDGIAHVVDLGCGTGAAGAAWALDAGGARITGHDRHPWAVAEANWTYRQLHLHGRALNRDVARMVFKADRGTGILASYVANELSDADRATLLDALLAAHARGARVLVIEPIARRISPWWNDWQAAVERANGRAHDWRFADDLPPLQASLARAAGLDPRTLTARSLWLG
jgi:hypothetical protein